MQRLTAKASIFPALAGALALIGAAPLACGDPAPGLSVAHAWARATPPGIGVGAAYFEITNTGEADELLAISTPVAQRVEMHATTMQGGLMQMRQVLKVAVPARGTLRFAPSGLHAMLLGLKQPLAAGQQVPLRLTLKQAGAIEVQATVLGGEPS
jgi:periplasmic copper chaperone A